VVATQSELSAEVSEALSTKDAAVWKAAEAMERALMRVEEIELYRLEEQVLTPRVIVGAGSQREATFFISLFFSYAFPVTRAKERHVKKVETCIGVVSSHCGLSSRTGGF
jgi:hypothetical protein